MKIINQSVELFNTEDYGTMLVVLEKVARNCYQSELNKTNREEFIKRLIDMGHYSILEHISFHFKITTDRSTANQIVRHRTGKFAQESQRYCNYSKDKFDNQITFIQQPNQNQDMLDFFQECEDVYFKLLATGLNPEDCRAVLPNATKTSLIMTMDLRNLRHFLNLRMSKHAQHNIREVAEMIYDLLKEYYPVFIHGLNVEVIYNE